MPNIIITIARKELSSLWRERIFLYAVGIFITMSILSTLIGWSSQHTVITVYEYASWLIRSLGQIPPVLQLQWDNSLLIVKNMIIYNSLIATLVAIIMGYYIGMSDRIAHVTKLIFTRPIVRYQIFFWKIGALFSSLLILTILSYCITLISLFLFWGISWVSIFQIGWFYGLSLIYILGFWFAGIWLSFLARDGGSALLYALILWIIIIFVLPEVSSALSPTNSLNPVLPDTNLIKDGILPLLHAYTFPFSVSEHYKNISLELIGANNPLSPTYYKDTFYDISVLVSWVLLTFIFTWLSSQKIDPISWDTL